MGYYQNLIQLYENESKKYKRYQDACDFAIKSIYEGLITFFIGEKDVFKLDTCLSKNAIDGSFFRNVSIGGFGKSPLTCKIAVRQKNVDIFSATIETDFGVSPHSDFSFKNDKIHIIDQVNQLYHFLYKNLSENIPKNIGDLVDTGI